MNKHIDGINYNIAILTAATQQTIWGITNSVMGSAGLIYTVEILEIS